MATAPLLAKLDWDRLRLRWSASALARHLAVWWEDLLALLPPGWQQRCFPPARRLWLRLEEGELRLEEEAGAERSPLPPLPLAGGEGPAALAASLDRRGVEGELWLALSPSQALRRELVLPLAAEAQLEAVLRHEIDRQTPFSPDQVVYASRVLARQPAEGRLRAELVVVPRAVLEAALAALGPLAGRLAGVDVDDAASCAGGRRNLLPTASRSLRRDREPMLRLALVGGTLLCLLAAGMLSLGNRERALMRLEAQRDAAFETAREARALRQQLEAAASAANFLAEQRAARPTVLEVLADLSARLPDDVHLQRLSVEQGRVTLTGFARSAGTVVPTLQASPYLKGPALVGTVQQDRATGRDGFTVVAELVPGGRDAPRP
ncbi:MAG: type II secretion system protein L [Silanimonas sp.]|nr:MAG: type II secretion system protein L [Silanimonas sp.]